MSSQGEDCSVEFRPDYSTLRLENDLLDWLTGTGECQHLPPRSVFDWCLADQEEGRQRVGVARAAFVVAVDDRPGVLTIELHGFDREEEGFVVLEQGVVRSTAFGDLLAHDPVR